MTRLRVAGAARQTAVGKCRAAILDVAVTDKRVKAIMLTRLLRARRREDHRTHALAAFRSVEPTYFVSHRLGVAYLQIPKAACSSIQATILAAEQPDVYHGLQQELKTSVSPIHHTPGLFETTREPGELLRFSFVRHPFDRVLSFHRNQICLRPDRPRQRRERLERELSQSGLRPGMSFRAYVEAIVADPRARENAHLRPQAEFLFQPDGFAVDYLGRVEEMARHERLLGRLLNRPDLAFPRFNATGGKGWRESTELTSDLIAVLSERYSVDLRAFGY